MTDEHLSDAVLEELKRRLRRPAHPNLTEPMLGRAISLRLIEEVQRLRLHLAASLESEQALRRERDDALDAARLMPAALRAEADRIKDQLPKALGHHGKGATCAAEDVLAGATICGFCYGVRWAPGPCEECGQTIDYEAKA